MKNYSALLLLLFVSTLALAQKLEKIKGSKTVTIEQKEIGNFNTLEVGNNIEVYLEKGEKPDLKIEADDNLHSIIGIDLNEKTLRINTSKEVTNSKKLIVRITYTNDLKMITSKNEAIINAIQEIKLEDISLKSFDTSKLNLNVDSKNFALQADDKSKIELNLKSENASITLSKNSTLKALITSDNLKCDLYQKAKTTLEGDVKNAVIRLDNNSEFTGNKLVIKNAELVAESYSNCSLNVNTNMSIEASGNSEIKLYGNQKIEMKKFKDSATLIKK
ncbi:GIN domain-containing protein [Flavobacterium sp.]|uniref:GIN domain-containing protein n=1 Tax=Flavobacterium sp. TaxID=239 RepID=UPI00379E8F7A